MFANINRELKADRKWFVIIVSNSETNSIKFKNVKDFLMQMLKMCNAHMT